MAYSEKRGETLVRKVHDYAWSCADLAQAKVRVNKDWESLIDTIREFELVDGDQQKVIELYKATYGLTPAVIRDINRAFTAAGVLKQKKKTPQKKAIERQLAQSQPSKRTTDQLLKTGELVEQGMPTAAAKDLMQQIMDGPIAAIDRIMRDNWNVISWEMLLVALPAHISWWHDTYDTEIEREKNDIKRSEEQSNTEQKKEGNG